MALTLLLVMFEFPIAECSVAVSTVTETAIWNCSTFTIEQVSPKDEEEAEFLGVYEEADGLSKGNFAKPVGRTGHHQILNVSGMEYSRRYVHEDKDYHLYLCKFKGSKPRYRWNLVGPVKKQDAESTLSAPPESPGIWNSLKKKTDEFINDLTNSCDEEAIIFEQALDELNVPPPSHIIQDPALEIVIIPTGITRHFNAFIERIQASLRVDTVSTGTSTNNSITSRAALKVQDLGNSTASPPVIKTNAPEIKEAKEQGLGLLNVICVAIASICIVVLIVCLFCMFKRHKKMKEKQKWNNVASSLNNHRPSQLIKRVSNAKKLLKSSMKAPVLQIEKKWKPEKFGDMMENSGAVQDVIFDDVLENMRFDQVYEGGNDDTIA